MLSYKGAVQSWQHWLLGNSFTEFSDHNTLKYMNIKFRIVKELGTINYNLLHYNHKIKSILRKNKFEIYCLSRNPVLESGENEDGQSK